MNHLDSLIREMDGAERSFRDAQRLGELERGTYVNRRTSNGATRFSWVYKLKRRNKLQRQSERSKGNTFEKQNELKSWPLQLLKCL